MDRGLLRPVLSDSPATVGSDAWECFGGGTFFFSGVCWPKRGSSAGAVLESKRLERRKSGLSAFILDKELLSKDVLERSGLRSTPRASLKTAR